jgi:hypothetical protein
MAAVPASGDRFHRARWIDRDLSSLFVADSWPVAVRLTYSLIYSTNSGNKPQI